WSRGRWGRSRRRSRGPCAFADPYPHPLSLIIDGGFGRSIVRGAGLAVGVVLVAAVVIVAAAARNVLVLVFIAIILASGLQPVVAWLRTHVRVKRGPAI